MPLLFTSFTASTSCTMMQRRKNLNWRCPGSVQKATTFMYTYLKSFSTRQKPKPRLLWRHLSNRMSSVIYHFCSLSNGKYEVWRNGSLHKMIIRSVPILLHMLGMRLWAVVWVFPFSPRPFAWMWSWTKWDRPANRAGISCNLVNVMPDEILNTFWTKVSSSDWFVKNKRVAASLRGRLSYAASSQLAISFLEPELIT